MFSVLFLIILAGALAILYGFIVGRQILAASPGNKKMQDIAEAIQIGARAYLNRQYKTISIVGFVILIIGPFAKKNIFFILLFSLVFSLFEFLRGNILTGFPWNLISYSWSWSLESLQILSLIGTYSLSLISITFFCIPFLFFKKEINKKNILFFLSFFIIFLGNYFYGYIKMNKAINLVSDQISNPTPVELLEKVIESIINIAPLCLLIFREMISRYFIAVIGYSKTFPLFVSFNF